MQRGRNWFISGASSGFGRLLAEYLLQQGATVVVTARRVEDIEDFTTRYPNSQIVPLDVTSQSSIDHAVQQAIAYVEHIDVLVNNAGFGVLGAVEEVTEGEYMPMFNTNLFGLVNLTKAFLPMFRLRRSGTIVNMSSVGGLIGLPGWGYYNASKFAVEGLSEALYQELKPMGIHVMTVEPGAFRTDFLGRSGRFADRRIADYEPTVGPTRNYMTEQDGRQPGDPAKGVEAIVNAVEAAETPQHLVLGRAALQRVRNHLQQWTTELDRWQDTSNGVDFAETGSATTTQPASGGTR